jgi:hypothetical protein
VGYQKLLPIVIALSLLAGVLLIVGFITNNVAFIVVSIGCSACAVAVLAWFRMRGRPNL